MGGMGWSDGGIVRLLDGGGARGSPGWEPGEAYHLPISPSYRPGGSNSDAGTSLTARISTISCVLR